MNFSPEQTTTHHLMLQSPFIKDIGLLHGKMGIALFFYHYAKHTDNTVYSDYADDLLDDVWKNLHNRLSDTFESGSTGIVWGVEYLIQNDFVQDNSNDICEDVDARIMQIDLRRMTPEFIAKELEGFLHYVLIRTLGTIKQQSSPPFDKMYRNDLFQLFSFLLQQNKTNETCQALIRQYLAYTSNGESLNYMPDLSLFIGECKTDEKNLFSSPLGLKNGLAGMLYKQINQTTL